MQTAEVEARAAQVLQTVNEWLRFAEAKNGALLTLNAAVMIGVHQLKTQPLATWLEIWLWWGTICSFLAVCVALASFFARTKTMAQEREFAPAEKRNVAFFGDLARMSKEQIWEDLGGDAATIDRFNEAIVRQIRYNSKIADRKFSLFNVALVLTMAGVLTPLGIGIWYMAFCDEQI